LLSERLDGDERVGPGAGRRGTRPSDGARCGGQGLPIGPVKTHVRQVAAAYELGQALRPRGQLEGGRSVLWTVGEHREHVVAQCRSPGEDVVLGDRWCTAAARRDAGNQIERDGAEAVDVVGRADLATQRL